MKKRDRLLLGRKAFMFIAFLLVGGILVGTSGEQHAFCHNMSKLDEFMNNDCCNPRGSVSCVNTEFCFGVAIAAGGDEWCCEAYPSCQEAKKLKDTIRHVEGIIIGELIVSGLVFIFVSAKIAASCCHYSGSQDANENIPAPTRFHFYCNLLTFVGEVIDLCLAIALITIIARSDSEEFVAELHEAACFPPNAQKAVANFDNYLRSLLGIAIAELLIDLVLISAHALEVIRDMSWSTTHIHCFPKIIRGFLNGDDNATTVGALTAVGDLLEFGLAIANFILVLQITGGTKAAIDSMKDDRASGSACIFNCCVASMIDS